MVIRDDIRHKVYNSTLDIAPTPFVSIFVPDGPPLGPGKDPGPDKRFDNDPDNDGVGIGPDKLDRAPNVSIIVLKLIYYIRYYLYPLLPKGLTV